LRWLNSLGLKASLTTIILLTTIFIVPAQTKAEKEEKITITIWEGWKTKTISRYLSKEDVERIKELLEETKTNLQDTEKLQELEHFLKEKGLLPKNFSLEREKKKMEKEFRNMTWGEFKKKMIREYPLFIPMLVMAFKKIERSTGIKEEEKLKDMERTSRQVTASFPGEIDNIACFIVATGDGYIIPSFPSYIWGLVPPSPIVIGLIGAITWHYLAEIDTMGLLGDLSLIEKCIAFTILIFIGFGISLGLIGGAYLMGIGGLVMAVPIVPMG